MKRFLERNPLERLTIPPVSGCITQQTLNVLHLSLKVATAPPQKRPANVTVQIDGFSCPVIFGNVKDQHRLIINDYFLFGDLDIVIDPTVSVKHGEKIILNLIRFLDAADFVGFTGLGDAEDQLAAVRVGKGGDGIKCRLRNIGTSLFELDIVPLARFESLFQVWQFHVTVIDVRQRTSFYSEMTR